MWAELSESERNQSPVNAFDPEGEQYLTETDDSNEDLLRSFHSLAAEGAFSEPAKCLLRRRIHDAQPSV